MKGSGLFEVMDIFHFWPLRRLMGPKVHSVKYAFLHDFCTRPPFFCTFLKTYICLHREGTPTHRSDPDRVNVGLPVAPSAAAGNDTADMAHCPI